MVEKLKPIICGHIGSKLDICLAVRHCDLEYNICNMLMKSSSDSSSSQVCIAMELD